MMADILPSLINLRLPFTQPKKEQFQQMFCSQNSINVHHKSTTDCLPQGDKNGLWVGVRVQDIVNSFWSLKNRINP